MFQILRFYAASFEKPRAPVELVPISTFVHQYLSTKELEKFRCDKLK